MDDLTRREWLGLMGAAALPLGERASGIGPPRPPAPPNQVIVANRSSTGVHLPPRGATFMKWSFDTPEPSVRLEGLEFAFKIFGRDEVFFLDQRGMTVEESAGGARLVARALLGAGGQAPAAGSLTATFHRTAAGIEWEVSAELPVPIKSVATVVRGLPRGRLSVAGGNPFDPKDNELLFGYPFSGGDLFGGNSASGMGTPLLVVQSGDGGFHFLSSLDSKVRTKRFYLQPGDQGYRIEAIHEVEGWLDRTTVAVPRWRIGRAETLDRAVQAHFEHLERAYRLPAWDTRPDVPDWLRRTSLVVALHGRHQSGYVFNTFVAMGEILRTVAGEISPDRVLVFLPAWDGRYYWSYPDYQADDRLGGPRGLQRLIAEGQAAGFRFMPMFGANAANRRLASFARFADAVTRKVDGDVMDLNWVDWDGDRHQEGWGAYLNLGVPSWRRWLTDRIADTIERYRVDAYFLDIIGGWTNNTSADMHGGARLLIEELRARYPGVLACGEFHYDALIELIPLYQVHSPRYLKYARYFSHLSHPAPGRGSSGVHESGFSRFDPATLGIPERDGLIPTLTVVDDTFTTYRDQALAVVREARRRSGAD